MKISKPWKIAIGITTIGIYVLPLILFVALMLFALSMSSSALHSDQMDPFGISFVFLMFPAFMCVGLLSIALYAFYAIHIIKNKEGSDILRILAILGMNVMPYLVLPAYFFIFIAPNQIPDWAREPTPAAPKKNASR